MLREIEAATDSEFSVLDRGSVSTFGIGKRELVGSRVPRDRNQRQIGRGLRRDGVIAPDSEFPIPNFEFPIPNSQFRL